MKSIVLTAMLLLGIVGNAFANVTDTFNIYLAGKIGAVGTFIELEDTATTVKERDFLASTGLGIAFGGQYYFTNSFGLRVEIEYLFRTRDTTEGKVNFPHSVTITTQSILSNVYFDYYILPIVGIYTHIGAGIGITKMQYESTTTGTIDTHSAFIWSIGFGTWYTIKPHIIVDLNMRYNRYKARDIAGVDINYLHGVDILASVRYLF